MSDSRIEFPDDVKAKFWRRVQKTDTCWLWQGTLNRQGYGHFSVSSTKTIRAHKFAYVTEVGSVPDGLTLDHVWPRCTNKHCVRPDHLEPVTPGENVRRYTQRITHCPAGHAYADHGYSRPGNPARYCRLCERARTRAARYPCPDCDYVSNSGNVVRHRKARHGYVPGT